MNKIVIGAIIFGLSCLSLFSLVKLRKPDMPSINYKKLSVDELAAVFPRTPAQIELLVDDAIEKAQRAVEQIIEIPDNQRTFANTIEVFDHAAGYDFSIPGGILSVIQSLDKDAAMRDKSREQMARLAAEGVDLFGQNKELYNVVKAYAESNALRESLDEKQRYFLDELMRSYQRAGLDKPDEVREQIKQLQKELTVLGLEFEKNIAEDKRTITVTRDELEGVDAAVIENLKKTDDGRYILGTDYPTYFPVMEYGAVRSTRERLWNEFNNRGNPANKEILKTVMEKRLQLASLLGFESYAALNLDDEMVKTPARATDFLNDLLKRTNEKERKEIALLKANLPASVSLAPGDKFYPWDRAYTISTYEKKHFDFDNREVTNYFPLESTLKGLLAIYEQFMGINFKELPFQGLWDESVKLIEVTSKERELLGYLLLDLFPRPDKYCHACQITVVPAVRNKDGSRAPALAVVIANFPKPSAEQPSLLELSNVRTFFHEFGHALHTLLGATQLASSSGTNVKMDFVELPSQMLEEWLWDPMILKKVSRHFKTNEQLPDELIKKLLAVKNLSSGSFVQRQAYLAFLSLNIFGPEPLDPHELAKKLHEKIRVHSVYDPRDHFELAFGHLMGYGARYYGYLWSKVFALDIFDTIRKAGLLDPVIGKKYVDTILAPGGSVDPNQLLRNFLGREPKADAFFKDLGIE
jgi:thimet oligopeptidase